jgi:hypothetical protein
VLTLTYYRIGYRNLSKDIPVYNYGLAGEEIFLALPNTTGNSYSAYTATSTGNKITCSTDQFSMGSDNKIS